MTGKVEPRVIDFSVALAPEERYREECGAINASRRFRAIEGPVDYEWRTSLLGISYMIDGDGTLKVKVPEPHPRVIRRVRRVLASCKRNPEFAYRPHLFFQHDRVRDVPNPVLKRIYHESEGLSA